MDRLFVLIILIVGVMIGILVSYAAVVAASNADDIEEAYWANKQKEGEEIDTDV